MTNMSFGDSAWCLRMVTLPPACMCSSDGNHSIIQDYQTTQHKLVQHIVQSIDRSTHFSYISLWMTNCVECSLLIKFQKLNWQDIAAFERLFNDDVSCGKTPLLLVAYAGMSLAQSFCWLTCICQNCSITLWCLKLCCESSDIRD